MKTATITYENGIATVFIEDENQTLIDETFDLSIAQEEEDYHQALEDHIGGRPDDRK